MHLRSLYRGVLVFSLWSSYVDALSKLDGDFLHAAQSPLQEQDSHQPDGLDAMLVAIERGEALDRHQTSSTALQALLGALHVMQEQYFAIWRGTWPTAIDWTAAVMGTQVSGALTAITQSSRYEACAAPFGGASGNTVAGYFSHISSFYFGENAFALRLQAYDDMLWVVLGWLEAIQFIRTHSDQHYDTSNGTESTWFAKHFIPAFAHRARIFWDLAHKGWDTTLCGGGMLWNPRLTPYKNAITNQLYIAASVGMYLHFPGDDNGVPFHPEGLRHTTNDDGGDDDDGDDDGEPGPLPPVKPHDKRYLDAAIEAYDWLTASGMTNRLGLFTDGFHITGWRRGKSNGTRKCDARNEMVYTYNQGVLLSGQRGLWRATGNTSYLDAGHALIEDVMHATGWRPDGRHRDHWSGLGRLGVLEEACDAPGRCSQDGQTFKGIFFHHLAAFCAPLPEDSNGSITHPADPILRAKHAMRCRSYAAWIARNARAAAGTRDAVGRFGTWWTVGLAVDPEDAATASGAEADADTDVSAHVDSESDPEPTAEEDYRNDDIPATSRWQSYTNEPPVRLRAASSYSTSTHPFKDPNRRGRGRTVETQSGGVAVLKALYVLVERRDGDGDL